jgi:carboxyl-terminal processing protease
MRSFFLGLLVSAPFALAPAIARAPEGAAVNADDGQAQAAMWATRFLTRFHYKRVPLDDAMSETILKRYLEALDGDKLFFVAADVDGFKRYQDSLDDAIYDQVLDPPFEIFRTYVARVHERTVFSRGLLEKGFDFTTDERYFVDRADAQWTASAQELDELWRKRVKNDWLRLRLAGKADEEIRKTLDKRYKSYDDRIGELDGEDVFQTFMNAYATAIEPHTGYLGPRASENFSIQMKLSLEGIGAVLAKPDEYTTIRTIVKGGPAAKSDQLKVGDRIVGVGQGGKGPVQDVIGWRLDDVVDMIRGPKGTSVMLDVLPADAGPDAKPVHLLLVREEVKLEEQAAHKSVIEIDDDGPVRKIGVISLPTFYHDFEGHRKGVADYRSSTRDVDRLLRELKAEGVEGVVMDLRDNGGGSLTEATDLTGLFIDQGPVVQVRDAQGRISVESDGARGVAWDGPLVVLVNRSSASASEIFAAALQDYGRALIVGETTYGKGTVQNLVDLDNIAQNDSPQFGQLKLTVAQFFRVNGGSTQHRGVEPDVAFPTTFDPAEWGESALENALPWTSIDAADYTGQGNFRELVPMLSAKHEARVAKDREYQYWLEDLAEYRKVRAQKELSLVESERKAERDAIEAKRKQRKAERDTLAEAESDVRVIGAEGDDGDGDDDSLLVDDGLQADERAAANARGKPKAADEPKAEGDDAVAGEGEEEDDSDRPDALLAESSRVLVDAIDLLSSDSRLAGRVKGFTLLESPTIQ